MITNVLPRFFNESQCSTEDYSTEDYH